MRINIYGDFATQERGVQSVKDGNAFTDGIIGLMQQADFNIMNLESPVACDSTPKISKAGPNLHTFPDAVQFLSQIGVNVVTLANNHFCDYGIEGVSLTISELEKNHIRYVGGGRDKHEKERILFLNHTNITVAVLNYCEHEFSVYEEYGSNGIDIIQAYHDICYARKHSDFVIVITHGGQEGYSLPTPMMQKLYRFFIELGANLVVNHHQHCYSGSENYGNGTIYYGLGNFFFDSICDAGTKWSKGFALSLILNKEDSLVAKCELYPYIQCDKDRPVVRLMNDNESKNFKRDFDDLNAIIANPNYIIREFSSFCNEKASGYLSTFSPYSNRYLRALCKRKLLPSFFSCKRQLQVFNLLRCESHIEATINILKMNLSYE